MPRGRTPPRHEQHQAEDGFLEPPPILSEIVEPMPPATDAAPAQWRVG